MYPRRLPSRSKEKTRKGAVWAEGKRGNLKGLLCVIWDSGVVVTLPLDEGRRGAPTPLVESEKMESMRFRMARTGKAPGVTDDEGVAFSGVAPL